MMNQPWLARRARPSIWPTPTAFRRSSATSGSTQIVAALEVLGLEVWEPFERNNQEDLSVSGWAYRIGRADYRDMRAADSLFAVVNGVPLERWRHFPICTTSSETVPLTSTNGQ